MSVTPVLLWLSLVSAAAVDEPYCSMRHHRLCQGKGEHVACQFPYPGPGDSCENYTQMAFSEDMQRFVTYYINKKRQRLAEGLEKVRGGLRLPAPAIMMQVEWDHELAALAQRLADQCNFVHDNCRATVRYPYAGQTVGEVRWRRSTDSDELGTQRAVVTRVIDAWWGERRRVLPQQLMAPFRIDPKGTVWGHFSQLAVWSLQAVGCGAVRYGAKYPRMLLVCDYSHTNMLGQRTLLPGPMALCPIHTARRARSPFPLLCAKVRRPNEINQQSHALKDQYDYEEYEQINEAESPTTGPTTEFVSMTTKTEITLESEIKLGAERKVSTPTKSFTEGVEDTDIPKYGLNVELHEHIERKDEQFDPLAHREGKQSYTLSNRDRFVDKLQHALGRYSDHSEHEKYNSGRDPLSSYAKFRENQEILAENHDGRKLPNHFKKDRQEDEQIHEQTYKRTDLQNPTEFEKKLYHKDGYETSIQIKDDNLSSIESEKVDKHFERRKPFYQPLVPRKQISITHPEQQKGTQEFPTSRKDTFQSYSGRKYLYESLVNLHRQKEKKKSRRPAHRLHKAGGKTIQHEPVRNKNKEIRKEDYFTRKHAEKELIGQRKYVYDPIKHKLRLKHSRRRPIRVRPSGAQPLLNRPSEKESLVAQQIDKDDVNQLIKDTGFNPYSKLTKSGY